MLHPPLPPYRHAAPDVVPGQAGSSSRIFGLDVLRAIAILAVVWVHGTELMPAGLQRYCGALQPDGVSIFFVLSGYLIGGILIRVLERDGVSFPTLWRFWARRWCRTLPNYYLVLLVLTGIHLSLGHRLWETAPYFVFLQNLTGPHPAFFIEAWSLSVEEWFYLLMPALLFAGAGLLRLPPRKVIAGVALLVIAAVTGLRWYRFIHQPPQDLAAWEEGVRKVVVFRLDALIYGVLGAYCSRYHPQGWLKYRRPLFVAGLMLAVVLPLIPSDGTGWYHSVLSFSVFAVGILALLPQLSTIRSGRGGLGRAITHISHISYSMYLIHLSLVLKVGVYGYYRKWTAGWEAVSPVLANGIGYLLYWAGTIALATLLYYCFERPVLKLRDRWLPANGRAVPSRR